MTERAAIPLWESDALRLAAGETLRPGGFLLTDRGAEVAGLLPGMRVLDVGCGLGATVERLRSRYGVLAVGVENSATQLHRATVLPGLVCAEGDALPFIDNAFDAVFCECVFSLFSDREAAMCEFSRILRPGGCLVLSDLSSSNFPVGESLAQVSSCADRALLQAQVENQARTCGFAVELVEDHSRHLKDLAARLILAGEGEGCGCTRPLGYFLMVARKEGFHA